MTRFENLPGVIFVMIGPGGAGKNAIMKAIISAFPAIEQLATATTRPMRADETQGREHLFVSERAFRKMISENELLEHQEVTPGKLYGIPRRTVEDALSAGAARIADIEVLGAIALAAAYPRNIVQLFVTVPGVNSEAQLALLEERMRTRADDATDIEQRLERARRLELPYQNRCDYNVVNADLERAIEHTSAIIRGEMVKRRLQSAEL
ncbi:MAG: guanylate kinase [Chloroflexota bacterium]|nr:guanylate kinase [Chloroflexota bacterium]MDE2908093.1 guanylate kinase [Chloroflexota bacterium]